MKLDPARLFLISQFMLKDMPKVTPRVSPKVAEGLAEGQRQEAKKFVTLLLQTKFSSVDETTETRLRSLSVEELERLGTAILSTSTLTEIHSFLDRETFKHRLNQYVDDTAQIDARQPRNRSTKESC